MTITEQSEHIVTAYDDELRALTAQLAEMGGMAERLVDEAVTALVRNDTGLAQRVMLEDQKIDALLRSIEENCVLLIARRQPMALDLRRIVGIMRTSSDLERVGDLAKNIAKRVVAISGPFQSKRFVHGVEHMAELALAQLKLVLDSYAVLDADVALSVRDNDEEIDSIYTSLFRELLTYMMEDPRNITQCTHLLFCAKNIERIGDHATNIAETVYFVATGEQIAHERAKDDQSSFTSVDPVSASPSDDR
ncbi:MAG: phosphate signaling complex protein PhoU [Pseudomonadota bacterium]